MFKAKFLSARKEVNILPLKLKRTGKRWGQYLTGNRRLILLWSILILFIIISRFSGLSGQLTAALVFLYGIATNIFALAFNQLIQFVSLIPMVGPYIARVLSWPLFILVNALVFLTALAGVKRGEGKKVLDARIIATIMSVGILIGYILGKIF